MRDIFISGKNTRNLLEKMFLKKCQNLLIIRKCCNNFLINNRFKSKGCSIYRFIPFHILKPELCHKNACHLLSSLKSNHVSFCSHTNRVLMSAEEFIKENSNLKTQNNTKYLVFCSNS